MGAKIIDRPPGILLGMARSNVPSLGAASSSTTLERYPMPYVLHHDHYGCSMHGTWEIDVHNADRVTTEFFRPIKYGQPLSDDARKLLPDPYRLGGPKGKPVPDVFGNDLGPWHVSDRLKDIIEELEPGVHSFIPINAIKVNKNGKQETMQPEGRKYFILHVQRVIKAVVLEETEYEGTTTADDIRATGSGAIRQTGRCTLYGSKIAGSHLWRGGIATYGGLNGADEAFWNHYFASDELIARYKAIGCTGWRLQPCDVK